MEKYIPFIKRKFDEYMRDLTSLGNPIVLIFILVIFFGFNKYLVLGLIGMAINECIGSLIKFFFHKKRPDGQNFNNSIEKIDAGSFPSIHSSRVSFVYLFLFLNTAIIPLKIVLILIILLVGFTRVYLKKHYLIDVIGGYFLGIFLSYLIYYQLDKIIFPML